MNRYLSLVAGLGIAIAATLFAGGIAQADWDDDSIRTGSLGLNLGVQSKNAVIDMQTCDDGKVAAWQKSNLTFQIVNSFGLDLYFVNSVRSGVLEWNNVGTSYSLTEVSTGKADITVQIVPLLPVPHLGRADIVCQTGANGIQSATILIGVHGLLPAALRNVSAHEVGHALGLGHAVVPGNRNDVMEEDFALLAGSTTVLCPSNLDVDALKAKADPYSILASTWAKKAC